AGTCCLGVKAIQSPPVLYMIWALYGSITALRAILTRLSQADSDSPLAWREPPGVAEQAIEGTDCVSNKGVKSRDAISVQEHSAWRRAKTAYIVRDVREANELDICRLEGALDSVKIVASRQVDAIDVQREGLQVLLIADLDVKDRPASQGPAPLAGHLPGDPCAR